MPLYPQNLDHFFNGMGNNLLHLLHASLGRFPDAFGLHFHMPRPPGLMARGCTDDGRDSIPPFPLLLSRGCVWLAFLSVHRVYYTAKHRLLTTKVISIYSVISTCACVQSELVL